MIESLHRDAYFRVERMRDEDLIRVARTGAHFPDAQAEATSLAAVEQALAKADRARTKVLLDVRDAPRGDTRLDGLVAAFVKRAVLGPGGFADEDAAFDHLMGT